MFFSIFRFFENISKTWVKNWVATVVAALIVMMGEFGDSVVDVEMVVILQEAERGK